MYSKSTLLSRSAVAQLLLLSEVRLSWCRRRNTAKEGSKTDRQAGHEAVWESGRVFFWEVGEISTKVSQTWKAEWLTYDFSTCCCPAKNNTRHQDRWQRQTRTTWPSEIQYVGEGGPRRSQTWRGCAATFLTRWYFVLAWRRSAEKERKR